ncbi:hypothetical protein CDL15_Pgr013111 [Punica granatum]|uniref:Isopenicillin N synthase-like Fe(2+) 2OG dioxygenase domain-containing protein n=1 Tax=Punica granatum TaxID=22663 RepID=A0A218WJA6_PUNGR|nr:hypothetical protein CDL15_Pgr013111 [Punica granatum]
MIQGIRRFHEQDSEVKREFHSRDLSKKVTYFSNFDLYQAPTANSRDTLLSVMEPDPSSQEELPDVCREILIEYSKQVKQLGVTIFELISEALGLQPNYFKEMEYAEQLLIGGFQVLHENQWVDVLPLYGALIVNIGDLRQLVSNDSLTTSVSHGVLSKREGPRISVACFFRAQDRKGNASRSYGPIPELISEENLSVYRNIDLKDYMEYYYGKGLDGTAALTPFKI